MPLNIPIPKFLAHLKIDERGYPIPYFVSKINGVYDFRYSSEHKVISCLKEKKCYICYKKLQPDNYYFITGPLGQLSKSVSEPPMHRQCAEFALQACPHILYQAAERKADESVAKKNPFLLKEKPPYLWLIKATSYKREDVGKIIMVRFTECSKRKFIYVEGKLQEV